MFNHFAYIIYNSNHNSTTKSSVNVFKKRKEAQWKLLHLTGSLRLMSQISSRSQILDMNSQPCHSLLGGL